MTQETIERLSRHASRLLEANRIPEAIAAFEQLLEREPNLPDSWYNLGYLQRRARRFENALDSYQQALDRGISQPEEVHLNRGVILAENLGRADAALTELKAALAINPSYAPALINLGGLYEDRGDRAEAKTAYEKALTVEPANALALMRLAGVAAVKDISDPLIERLRQASVDPRATSLDRADLGFALGQTLNSIESYDEAFAAYAAANRASRAALGSDGAFYDPRAHETFIDRLIHTFSEVPVSDEMESAEAPLFICGMFRSGSTLAERILASHSRVTAAGELDLLPALVGSGLQPYPEAALKAEPGTFKRLRTNYLDGLRAVHACTDVVTDKRPDNFLHIGLIKRMFPTAKIVHSIRNPVDNCLAIWFAHLDPRLVYALDLTDIAHWHRQYLRLMAHWQSLWPADIHDFDYDALVADPRPQIESLLDFCELAWEDACLSPHKALNSVRTLSAWQVREPLYRSSSGRWRNYEAYLDELRQALDVT